MACIFSYIQTHDLKCIQCIHLIVSINVLHHKSINSRKERTLILYKELNRFSCLNTFNFVTFHCINLYYFWYGSIYKELNDVDHSCEIGVPFIRWKDICETKIVFKSCFIRLVSRNTIVCCYIYHVTYNKICHYAYRGEEPFLQDFLEILNIRLRIPHTTCCCGMWWDHQIPQQQVVKVVLM